METLILSEGECRTVAGQTVCVAVARGGTVTMLVSRHEIETCEVLRRKAAALRASRTRPDLGQIDSGGQTG